MHRLVSLLLLLPPLAAAADLPEVLAASPLVELPRTVQSVGPQRFRVELRLGQALAGSKETRTDLTFEGSRIGAADGTSTLEAAGWKVACDDWTGLRYEEGRLAGTIPLRLRRDGQNQDATASLTLEAPATALTSQPPEPNHVQTGRWWRIIPHAQAAVASLAGTYSLKMGEDAATTGRVEGVVRLPTAPGVWNMGTWNDGLVLHFEMGQQRQNWNHARLAELPFADAPRDCSAFAGLRLRVSTPRPRQDVSVSVWLREADGSWYYVKSAVPLAAADNQAVLTWEDFEEAEWVAPDNHMDEDYIMDTKQLGAVAVGIVNSLGVGPVDFRLEALELVRLASAPTGPTQVEVSGRTLAVNGFDTVPVGLFGGFADLLPQQFRPGSQRILHHGMTSAPTNLRVRAAALDRLEDLPGLQDRLATATAGPVKILWESFDAAARQRIQGYRAQPTTDPKVLGQRGNDLLALLRTALAKPFWRAAATWQEIDLPQGLRTRLERAGQGAVETAELAELDRDLLATLFPGQVPPRPPAPTEAFVIDCQGDRHFPATYLINAEWETALTNLGRSFATANKEGGLRGCVEFWNEAYLNWGEHSRVNYKVDFYRQDLAVAGGEVSVKRPDGRPDVVPHLRWVPAGPGENVSRTKDGLKIVDETAFSYWSGRANGHLYDRMYTAFAKAVKSVDPTVTCVAGWGFRWHEDHWGAWDLLYKPTIDRNIDLIDGLCEHHYQGDPIDMHGPYEVLVGYGATAHRKWLRCYCTETNDLVDAPARGVVNTPAKVAAANDYRRCIFSLRDIIHAVAQVPDKAASRAVIHCDPGKPGSQACFGLLYDLRGRLIKTISSDRQVWCAASVDGTDPLAMPAQPGQRLVAVLFNDHRHRQEVELVLKAPTGYRFTGVRGERIAFDPETWVTSRPEFPVRTGPQECQVAISLEARSAAKVVLNLDGSLVAGPAEVQRRQYFSPQLLQEVQPGKDFRPTVAVDPARLAQAQAACLRLVVEDLAPGEGTVEIGPVRLGLPKAYTRDNGNRIIELPLDPRILTATNTLRFSAGPGHDGYRVDLTSIVLEGLP